MLINMLEGPTQGEILPLSLHELKKDEEVMSLDSSLGKNSSWWNRCTEASNLSFVVGITHNNITAFGDLWVTYSVTHIHSGKGKSHEGIWLSCVSASLCPEILVSCWEVKSICLDSATWKYNCVGSLCYDTTCYLHIITAQVFSILEFDVHCWIGLFKCQGKLKEFVFGSWKDQELSCIMCELTPPTHSE